VDGLTIGVYGLYLILVGLNGNAGQLASKVQVDAPKFLPWIIAIFVLAFINSSSEEGRKITGPFIALLVIAFVVKRFPTLQSQAEALWNMAAQSGTSNPNPSPIVVTAPPANGVSTPSSNAISGSTASDALFALENVLG
jgi:hypothetical protein